MFSATPLLTILTITTALPVLASCSASPPDSPVDSTTTEEALSAPVSPGAGTVPGVPLATGGDVYFCKDALLDGFKFFARLNGFFPSVMHSSHSVSPTHQLVDMAYATTGTMTFKNVVVPASGTYTMTIRYAFASGLFGGVNDRPMGIQVNGVVVDPSMSFPITGSFSVFQDSSIDVPLNAGQNEIQVFNISEHGVSRVDTMTLVRKP